MRQTYTWFFIKSNKINKTTDYVGRGNMVPEKMLCKFQQLVTIYYNEDTTFFIKSKYTISYWKDIWLSPKLGTSLPLWHHIQKTKIWCPDGVSIRNICYVIIVLMTWVIGISTEGLSCHIMNSPLYHKYWKLDKSHLKHLYNVYSMITMISNFSRQRASVQWNRQKCCNEELKKSIIGSLQVHKHHIHTSFPFSNRSLNI